MIDVAKLPAVVSLQDIRRYLVRCDREALQKALERGEIKGKKLHAKRWIYETASVVKWLGLEVPEPSAPPEKPKRVRRRTTVSHPESRDNSPSRGGGSAKGRRTTEGQSRKAAVK